MKVLLSVIILLLLHAVSYANCRGCCSWHGGVCCVNGVTQCCDGTPLSSRCRDKGCNACPSDSGTGETTQIIKVRLYGIDCPELSQNYGQEAKRFTESLVLSKKVTVEKKDTDIYGRVVGLVYLPDGTLLNEELVKNGYAWVYDTYCTDSVCSTWKTLEQQARQQGKGLWQDSNPIPPWEYRAQGVLITGTSTRITGYVTDVYDGDTIEIQTTTSSTSPGGSDSKGGCTSLPPLFAYAALALMAIVKLYRRAGGRL